MQLLNYTIVVDQYPYSSENKLYFMSEKKLIKRQVIRDVIGN